MAWILTGGAGACSIPFVYLLVARPGIRVVAMRGPRGRPAQALLVITGVAVAVAIIASAGEVGDSLRASVRRGAVTQLGPIDEEVVTTGLRAGSLQTAVDRARPTGVAGTLPLVTLEATVRGRDFVARVAPAQIVEVDFNDAARFGGATQAAGIAGPTPSGATAVMSADLSDEIGIEPGHRVTVYAYGTSRTFRIDRIEARRGIAGLAPISGATSSTSLNLFVPPGTIESMLPQNGRVSGQALPVSVVAVANRPDDRSSAGRAAVFTALRAATRGTGAEVRPVKEQLLETADAQSRAFTELFRAFGLLGALGGLLLLFVTFLMLARDRSRGLGILRALGLGRAAMASMLALEGWTYAVAGTAVGAACSIGLTGLVIAIARVVFADRTVGRIDLAFSVSISSLAIGCAIGLLASLATVTGAAWAISRRNLVRTMRALPDPPAAPHRRTRRALAAAAAAAGLAVTVTGAIATEPISLLVGPVLIAGGAAGVAYTSARRRLLLSGAAAAVLVWSALAVGIVPGAFRRLDVSVVVTEGIVTTFAALTLLEANRDGFTRWISGRSGRGPAFSLGYAYTRTSRLRSALITATYSLVLFTLTLLVTIASLYAHDVNRVAQRIGGGAGVEVTSDAADPVPIGDVARQPGVVRVTPAAALEAELRLPSAVVPIAVEVVGFDDRFAGHGAPELKGSAGSARAIFDGVASHANEVLVGVDAAADAEVGLAGHAPRLGDLIAVRNPRNGRSLSMRVAGLVDEARYRGVDHIYVGRAAVNELAGRTASSNLLFVETSPDTNDDVLAAVIDGTHLVNGTSARSFHRLASEALAPQRQFVDILSGYAAIGLIAVLVGIAALMIDRVRERRRQIAILRALGFQASTIRRSVRVETAVIALEGTITGVLAGVLVAWRVQASGALGAPVGFAVPALSLVAIAAVVLVVSLVAATAPARRAGRIHPASSLRAG